MKKLLFLLMFVMIIAVVSAVPPTGILASSIGNEGFDLKIPPTFVLKENTTFEFEVHVYNISNGVPITSGIECYFHLYNYTGHHVLEMTIAAASHTFDYNFNVLAENITSSISGYVVQCNNTYYGGFDDVSIQVTPTGNAVSEDTSTEAISRGIYFVLVMVVLFFVAFLVINNNQTIKWSFFILSVLFMLIGLNSIAISMNNNLYESGLFNIFDQLSAVITIFFWLLFGILIAIWVFTTLASLADKKTMRQAEATGNPTNFR